MHELRELVWRHFPDAQPVIDAIDSVVADEILHMQYSWACMDSTGHRVARMIYPMIVKRMLVELPSFDEHFNTGQLRRRYSAFRPDCVPPELAPRIWNGLVDLPAW